MTNAKNKIPVKLLTCSAMLIALEVVLNRFCSFNTMGLKIGFSFVPIAVAAYLFGPVCAAAVYGTADLIGAILFPIGPYHPGFTLCAAAMGFVYGIFLHRKKDKSIRLFPNIIVPALVNNLFLGLFVNTFWVSMLYSSKAYWGWFVYRLPEYAVLIPLNILMIPIIVKLCDQLKKSLHI